MNPRQVVCEDLGLAIDGLKSDGFRLDVIYPADDPHTALLSRGAEAVRVTTRPDAPDPGDELPPFAPEFVLTRAGGGTGEGRAGMMYRDLIPGRLGGRYIASHITIPEGGPVSDWVHFHRVAVQLIHVRRGWVRVVYEGQGPPFVLHTGDLVLQPPGIRHRVLESSDGLEVIEISCPALHETLADHELALPTGRDADRRFGEQRFVRHVAAQAPWTAFAGGEAQETAIADATGGIAAVRVVRPVEAGLLDVPAHDGELVFGFVLEGSGFLDFDDGAMIAAGDAFAIPPGPSWRVTEASRDLRLLHVTTARL